MTNTSIRNLNILVVDDESSTIISVAFVLKHCGHTVDSVQDGEDALLKLKEDLERYHILITDHAMMKTSGLQLMEQLRTIDFRGKVVVLSSNLTRDLKDSYTALGADRFISKPFDLIELRQTIEDLGAALGQ